ncbi:pyroglutamyl-peptidase I [Bifidobacterium leontopitheci]|uniref:Pyroglutamyl-peptidase I n=1 Tax=Bifidobacterium leontopitheci TaxID=2650774 RepID=A0A6I1GJF0_9BIFI|nr:pyroglutamyl-peptidase I [Bifidobacterium leontopitheci]KAB7789746.1 peptidase C15 [Bifidobacterium leontopitheci]
MQRLNVVISGFDHYDGVDVNPAAEVPRALAEQGIGAPADSADALNDVSLSITTVALPVSFANAWPTLKRTIEAVRPNIVIATGLKHAARGIAMERCATNLMDAARPDVDNALPRSTPIIPDGPAAYWTRLPLRAIINDFAHDGIPATLSSDAGTFVCNSLFYHLLNWASDQSRVLAGFVSFPLVCEGDVDPMRRHGLPLDQQIHAGRDVVRETVRYYMQPSSSDILLA